MVHAYSADYLVHSQQALGGMLTAGVYLFEVPADEFWGLFISAGYAARFSTADLARIAEVSPRMVGKYESREKDINHAQADVVGRLAVALHVDAADLYERIIPGNDYADFTFGG